MKKIVRYETPKLVVTRFEVDKRIMNGIVIPPGGGDGDITFVPGDNPESDPDLVIPGMESGELQL